MRHQHRDGHVLEQVAPEFAQGLVPSAVFGECSQYQQIDPLIGTAIQQGIADTQVSANRLFTGYRQVVASHVAGNVGFMELMFFVSMRTLNRHQLNMLCPAQQRHGIVQRARGFGAATPDQHDPPIDPPELSGVRNDQHRPAGPEHRFFRQIMRCRPVGAVKIGLADDQQVVIMGVKVDGTGQLQTALAAIDTDPLGFPQASLGCCLLKLLPGLVGLLRQVDMM